MSQYPVILTRYHPKPKRSKYGNRKVTKNGETFDSVREYERHLVLLDMQKHEMIRNLQRQPRFTIVVNDEEICTYVGDWRYEEIEHFYVPGHPQRMTAMKADVVEDSKGFQTPDFKLKWKLAKALYPEIDWRLS